MIEWDVPSDGRPPKSERATFAATCLASGVPPYSVVTQLQRCCNVSQRSAWRDLAEARKLLRLWNSGTVDELRDESAAFYRSILTSSEASIGQKIKARAQLDKLLGLQIPAQNAKLFVEKQQQEQNAGKTKKRHLFRAVLEKLSREELQRFADLQAKMRAAYKAAEAEEELQQDALIA
ncbi:hypothetical protein [Planctellipticum variicoloris]|uniref:hypothetical protein n=1 Tax=Planctellipticum variicoloris TaxID=3064265 RepID=UPI0030139C77|nr:hypothetical protein SH412_003261 [Planctomycetaceae bacterium SH412]